MGSAGIGGNVEGLHAVAAAVRAGRVEELLVESQLRRRPEVTALIDELAVTGGAVTVTDSVADVAETESPQGLVARATPIRVRSLQELVEASDNPAIVVLDHLEDPRNVGAIARSALAASMSGIVVSDRRSAPLGAAAFKAAAGAFESLPVAVVRSIADAAGELRRRDVWTVGMAADGEKLIFGLELFTEPVALVIGGEGRGLSRLVAERVDVTARIPMNPRSESLNAGVAAALAMFEVKRVRATL